jgi:hypothetical protein
MTSTAPIRPSTWQITVAAQGIAAAQFARCGFDVSVQYGSDKPNYDLVVTKADNLLKVSVKGSEDGCWDLAQSFLKTATEQGGTKAENLDAIELWLDHQASRVVCCFVLFEGIAIDQLPRLYLASPKEIAKRLRKTAKERSDSTPREEHVRVSSGDDTMAIEEMPLGWRFSLERIQELLAEQESAPIRKPPLPKVGLFTRRLPSSDKLSRLENAFPDKSA